MKQVWRVASPEIIGVAVAVAGAAAVVGALLQKAGAAKEAEVARRLAAEAEEDFWRRKKKQRRREEEARRREAAGLSSGSDRSFWRPGGDILHDRHDLSTGTGLSDHTDLW